MSMSALRAINEKRSEVEKNIQTLNGDLESAERDLEEVKHKIDTVNNNLADRTKEMGELIESMIVLAKSMFDLSKHYQDNLDSLKLQDGDFLNFVASRTKLLQEHEQKLIQCREQFQGKPKLFRKAHAETLKDLNPALHFLLEKEEDEEIPELLFIVELLRARLFNIANSK